MFILCLFMFIYDGKTTFCVAFKCCVKIDMV